MNTIKCPYCGNEMDEYEEWRYRMCQACWDEQQSEEDEDDYDYEEEDE